MSSSAKNFSFVLQDINRVKFEDRPVPELKDPHDVQVNVRFTGICGSDVHYWTHGAIGKFIVREPMVLGHESSGVVTATGTAVKSLKVGDRVALEPGIPCRRCEPCKAGKYNLCPNVEFAATPPHDGTLSKYYVLPEDFCYTLPDNVSLEEGALLEPLSAAVHIIRQGDLRPGDTVVVFGAGPVGQLCCAVARAFGASAVIAVDLQPSRIEFAQNQNLVTGAYVPGAGASASDNAEGICNSFDLGPGADVAIDASGAEASINTAIHVLRPGGTYVQGGMGKDEINFPIMAACSKELNMKGSFRYNSGDYKLALQLVTMGRVNVKDMVTKIVEFENAEQAFVEVKAGKGIKTLIQGVKE